MGVCDLLHMPASLSALIMNNINIIIFKNNILGLDIIEKNFAMVEHYFTNIIASKMGGSGMRGIELDFEYAQFEIDDMFENSFQVPTVKGLTKLMHNEDFSQDTDLE